MASARRDDRGQLQRASPRRAWPDGAASAAASAVARRAWTIQSRRPPLDARAPASAAAAGMAGKRYGGSLLFEIEKNTKTVSEPERGRRTRRRPRGGTARQRRSPRRRTARPGRNPSDEDRARSSRSGPGRFAAPVAKRCRCSWMKKNCRKPGMALLGEEEPGSGEDEEHGRAGEATRARELRASRPVARHQSRRIAPGQRRGRSRPFVRKAPAARRAGPRGQRQPGPRPLAPPDRRAAGEERRREEERQQPVGQVRARHEEADRARETAGCRPRGPRAAAAPRGEDEQQDGAEPREPRRQPRRPGRLAEDAERGRVRPSRAAAASRSTAAPFRRGTTRSPAASISRGISA